MHESGADAKVRDIRWLYILVHKREHGLEMLTEPFSQKEAIRQRTEFLKLWKL